MNYLLVVQVFVRTTSWGLVGHFCVEINTQSLVLVSVRTKHVTAIPAMSFSYSQKRPHYLGVPE